MESGRFSENGLSSSRLNDPLPVLTMEEAKTLMAGPFGEELHRIVANHMTWLVFGTVGPTGEAIGLQNGTCFFVKTPLRLLGVTARHVLDGLRRAREADPNTRSQIGNLLIDPLERVVGQGDKADIATFEISSEELGEIGKVPISLWPPHPPDVDDKGVLLAGYPAKATISASSHSRCFGIYAASGVAQRVTDWQLTCRIEWENTQKSTLGALPPRNFETGGMSGGPVLSIREKNGILSFPLAGVISEGDAATDTIIAERADSIRPNGDIRC